MMTAHTLNTYVAQESAGLTECRARPIGGDFPNFGTWLSSAVLIDVYIRPLPTRDRAVKFKVVRHAAAAIEEYDDACDCLSRWASGERKVSLYFRCLRRFEAACANVYLAYDAARSAYGVDFLSDAYATPGGDNPRERLRLLYNIIRHANVGSLPDDHLHPVWIRNDGLHGKDMDRGRLREASLTFDELRAMIGEIALEADRASQSDPGEPGRDAGE